MTTEQRLRAALDARAATAAPSAAALAEIRRRAGRARWTARLQVAAAAAAVTALVAGAAVAFDDDRRRDPAPPVASEPASPLPSSPPSPSAEPSPAAQEAIGTDEFVALLPDGRLVAASATTGLVTRTILAGAGGPAPEDAFYGPEVVTIAPDRESVFLAVRDTSGACDEARIEQVDVGTGRRAPIGAGTRPDISQDGTRLAYITTCSGAAVVVRDLRTGVEQRFAHTETEYDAQGNPMPWSLDRAVWHADGRRLWVVVTWENDTELRLLDPATDRTTGDAAAVEMEHTTFFLDRGGATLVYVHSCCYADDDGEDLLVVGPGTGEGNAVLRVPARDDLARPLAGPGGDVIYERAGRLYRLDAERRTSTDLGAATARARDW